MAKFHTMTAEFEGDDPAAVLRAVHAHAQKSHSLSFAEWCTYQTQIWHLKYGVKILQPETSSGQKKLLELLIEIGALDKGPLANAEGAA